MWQIRFGKVHLLYQSNCCWHGNNYHETTGVSIALVVNVEFLQEPESMVLLLTSQFCGLKKHRIRVFYKGLMLGSTRHFIIKAARSGGLWLIRQLNSFWDLESFTFHSFMLIWGFHAVGQKDCSSFPLHIHISRRKWRTNCSFFLSRSFSLSLSGTAVWTQGLAFARQSALPFELVPSPFLL
jgi:hypothetical protein